MIAQSRIALAAGLLVLTGVGPTLDAQKVRQRDAQGREVERTCQPAQWPKQLPALDAVLDSTALFDALQALPEGDTTSIVLSVLYEEGKPTRVRLLQPDVGALPSATAIVEVASRGLRPLSPPGRYAALRVRLTGGVPKSATVDRSVFCPPELTPAPGGPGGVRRIMVQVEPGDRLPTPGRRIRIDAEVFINEGGHVSDVRLITGSGIREIDENLLREQRERVYLPAMLDGFAIPGWVRTNGPRMRL